MWKLKKWWSLSKLLTITFTNFNFWNCPVKLERNLKLKFRSKFNHGYLHSAVWKALYNFKIKRAQEARHNQYFLKMFKIMKSLRSSKCLKTTVELTFTTQKANACSPWTACSVFNWKYLFWVNLVQKIISWNFVPRLVQICRIPRWCSLFLFSTGNIFLGKFGPKNQNWQFVLKFRTRLIWICTIM